jgi:hypothetical protein
MLISHTVKDTILFPFIYALVFLAVLLVLCAFNIVHTMGVDASLLPALSEQLLPSLLPHAIAVMFLLALFLTNFFILIRLQRKPGIRFISFVLILACCFILFITGYSYINESLSPSTPPAGRGAPELGEIAAPRKLLRFRDATLYFEGREGDTVRTVVLVKDSPDAPDIVTYNSGSITAGPGELDLAAGAPVTARYNLKPLAPVSSVFAAEGLIGLLISHYEKLKSVLNDLYVRARTEFYLFSLSLLFLILAAGFFMRLSRWALFNVFLYLFVVFLIFVFNNFVMYTMIPELKKIIGAGPVLNLAPSIVMLIIGGTFFLLDFLLLPQPDIRRKSLRV